ncbi:unnamed protein product [Chironomus riparius]|uniref:Uncharacterized protein n=1 Tax=Chironomus riparius TaxID=315576 RepID=A0A9N9WTZ8_9DIPT|nr:unnamed protein product [Chironomus riparius]
MNTFFITFVIIFITLNVAYGRPGPKEELSELNESNEEIPLSTKEPKGDIEPFDPNNGNINYYSRRIVCINKQCEITVCVNGKCKKETKNSNK